MHRLNESITLLLENHIGIVPEQQAESCAQDHIDRDLLNTGIQWQWFSLDNLVDVLSESSLKDR